VPTAEEHDMRQQRKQLVQPNAVSPAGLEQSDLLITRQDDLVVRAAEQRQHREVALAVTGVCGWVDQHLSLIHI